MLAAGTRLGAYEILGLIGAGGMGEVYRGRDTRLDRTIALKLLPPRLADDPVRRARFEREARAIATLNHPNIVTIYSVEEADGLMFLTMEFVEGPRLGDLIPARGLPIDRLLRISVAIADAIVAAQQRGVTHRDLKPANILVTPAGQVKVLDFGIARVSLSDGRESATTAIAADLTGNGHIVGTIPYMSPEQAEGRAVDSRSDIFSFGVILHQMATGASPFRGDTPVSILSAIVKDTPAAVTTLRPDLPPDLGRIIRRCLAKDPDRRYQSATDLRNDLEDLQAALLAGDTASGIAAGPPRRGSSWRRRLMEPAAILATLAAAMLVLAGVPWGLSRRPPPTESIPLTGMTMMRLTHTGTAEMPAISPDGKYVAHVVNEGGRRSLWLRQVATAGNVQIVPPVLAFYSGVAFSPDGSHVYYATYEGGYSVAMLWQVPALGGTPRRILNDVDSPVSFAPDGKRFVFVRNVMVPAGGQLVIANADGTDERILATRRAPERLDTYVAPAWSPDGKYVAVSQVLTRGSPEQRVAVFDVEGGTTRPLGARRWRDVGDVAWLADGSALAVSASEQGSTNRQLWRMAYPGGEVTRITNDLANYTGVSLSADSRSLVTVQTDTQAHIWVMPDGDLARARQVTSGTGRSDGVYGMDWTPDGRIVYASGAGGTSDIWIADADGTHLRALSVNPSLDYDPTVTPDGRFVVFTSTRSGTAQIWRMDVDGGNPVQLARHNLSTRPACAGSSVIYNVIAPDESRTVWRVPVEGGEAVQVSDQPVTVQAVSPDGRMAAGTIWNATENRIQIAVVTLGVTGPPTILPVFPRGGMAWVPEGGALGYVDIKDGVTNIFSRSIQGGSPRQLTTFATDQIFDFAWSRDGRRLAFSRGTTSTDVVLLSARK